eukprot:851751-Rhodomonas_salina.2
MDFEEARSARAVPDLPAPGLRARVVRARVQLGLGAVAPGSAQRADAPELPVVGQPALARLRLHLRRPRRPSVRRARCAVVVAPLGFEGVTRACNARPRASDLRVPCFAPAVVLAVAAVEGGGMEGAALTVAEGRRGVQRRVLAGPAVW